MPADPVEDAKPQITSAQFGPVLSKASAGGREDTMREIITNGTPRMPGFNYNFDANQITAAVSDASRFGSLPLTLGLVETIQSLIGGSLSRQSAHLTAPRQGAPTYCCYSWTELAVAQAHAGR